MTLVAHVIKLHNYLSIKFSLAHVVLWGHQSISNPSNPNNPKMGEQYNNNNKHSMHIHTRA